MDRTVVLVEGASDQVAVITLAARLGRDLTREGVLVAATGGATNIGHHLERLGPRGLQARLAGLYDASEERFVRKGLDRAGIATPETRADLEALGFFACVHDLEDELTRALGIARVLKVIEEHGDLPAFRILQQQPAHRDSTDERRLQRFWGTTGGRKTAYAAHFVEALDLAAVPRPLDQLLKYVAR
ncbi:MAG TPA: TOPRIM nucleotidyl transferase/hydrolase domain-containing protein [Nocardioides sp.]|nr:TOPRIM nucleotidyl transferase/hydrolase domain-containing protein [Nocardioides sp.]